MTDKRRFEIRVPRCFGSHLEEAARKKFIKPSEYIMQAVARRLIEEEGVLREDLTENAG